VQEEIVRSIAGLENAQVLRHGYGIEYDYCPPVQLLPSLESRRVGNLYLAGRSTARPVTRRRAAQGLMAGINAALRLQGREPFVLRRDEAYIGVLIDDLVCKGIDEPYRMFTSRPSTGSCFVPTTPTCA